MLIDARTLATDEAIQTEVCIIGSGPAGLTLAREFLDQDFKVCLLESGNLQPDPDTQALCQGEVVGDPFPALDIIRRRQCGGTAHAWELPTDVHQIGVKFVPLDPIDFEQREWIPYSGWPFDRAHLDPFYERAQAVCKIGKYAYDAEDWATAEAPTLPFVGDRVKSSVFQFGDSLVFTRDYRDQIIKSKNVTLYLNANVVELETDDFAKTVTSVRVACLSGKQFRVSAKIVIMAAGGVENARLLLLSNRVQQAGLGNQHDVVGRFYIDHPLVRTGMFIPSDRNLFNAVNLYDWIRVNNLLVKGRIGLTDETMRSEHLLHMASMISPRYPSYETEAACALKRLLGVGGNRTKSQNYLRDISQVVIGADDLASAVFRKLFVKQPAAIPDGWSDISNKEKKFGHFDVFSPTEQAPDPDNRLTLSEQRDALGCRQSKLHWRWRDIDVRSVERHQQILAEDIARSGLGQLKIVQENGRPLLPGPGAHHPMGVTRMHVDPKQGVVDADARVHSTSNLFIAGSSVFPTGGFANPTLTIVALSIRLADTVKQTIALDKMVLV
ncbi:GMC family oxidoreductase [Phormidium tenue FACHB-886]|nr:GMC family oxidoreductase [Phormidium tenue FACHB-886]